MNNLLKIFLIINLFSATTATNNSSLPLSGIELKMGQNISELVKRDESISVYGGMKVIGLTPSGGELCQRSCTLSFPVSFNNDKGFLTSYDCAVSSVLLGDKLIGHVDAAFGFKPEFGLEYTFISVYDSYWSDEISSKIDYSHCARTSRGIIDIDEPLLIIPTPNQSLSVGDKVYAHGGESGMVHGEILATDATITVHVPGYCEKEHVQFNNVVKVAMSKNYQPSALGAPVYLVVQVPDSTQNIVSPVGQVVEEWDWDLKTSGQNIWYYIPLDRILRDSGLKLVVGNFSSLVQKPNNTDFNDVLFPDNLTTESNTSESKSISNHLDKRQVLSFFTYPGLLVFSATNTHHVTMYAKQCTLGFPIKKISGQRFDHGFLTLGSCMTTDREGGSFGAFYLRPTLDPNRPEQIRIGSIGRLVYSRQGLNYAIVALLPNSPYGLWSDLVSADIQVPGGFAAITDVAFNPGAGTRVCFEGGYSGHICGEVTDPAASFEYINPWDWEAWIREQILGVFQTENWVNLIKVRLDVLPRAFTEDVKHRDFGSPVYYVRERDAGDRATKVQPVGILMDYFDEWENNGNTCELVLYMYCVSVYRILSNDNSLQLIGDPAV